MFDLIAPLQAQLAGELSSLFLHLSSIHHRPVPLAEGWGDSIVHLRLFHSLSRAEMTASDRANQGPLICIKSGADAAAATASIR
ncbi:hypothetical protein [Herbaspirillum huttiense]|uniref:hypothetical protein n=1 Tax=Herbaspirillum huttiense TaxID=863372 RepID=UPI000585AB4E|nr:hypothetical protein [Herbaspirillum huttiense]